MHAHELLAASMRDWFDDALNKFSVENQNVLHIRRERIENQFDRRIAQDQQRIETLRQSQSRKALSLAEARLRTAQRNRAERLSILERKAKIDVGKVEVAVGLVDVRHER